MLLNLKIEFCLLMRMIFLLYESSRDIRDPVFVLEGVLCFKATFCRFLFILKEGADSANA